MFPEQVEELVHVARGFGRPVVQIHRIAYDETLDRLVFGIIFQIIYYLCGRDSIQCGCEDPKRVAYGDADPFPSIIDADDPVHNFAKLTKSMAKKERKLDRHQWISLAAGVLVVMLLTYLLIAHTPLRRTIPGYPSRETQQAALENFQKVDSLEKVIGLWAFQVANIQRIATGREPLPLDSLRLADPEAVTDESQSAAFETSDSLLRAQVEKLDAERQADILSIIANLNYEVTDSITPEEYMEMRRRVGWSEFPLEQAAEGLAHSAYIACFRREGKPIALTRVIWDHGYVVYIADVIVLPDYQKNGLGRELMNRVIAFIRGTVLKPGYRVMISLQAAKGKEAFYERFGFIRRPNDDTGCGMHQWMESKR